MKKLLLLFFCMLGMWEGIQAQSQDLDVLTSGTYLGLNYDLWCTGNELLHVQFVGGTPPYTANWTVPPGLSIVSQRMASLGPPDNTQLAIVEVGTNPTPHYPWGATCTISDAVGQTITAQIGSFTVRSEPDFTLTQTPDTCGLGSGSIQVHMTYPAHRPCVFRLYKYSSSGFTGPLLLQQSQLQINNLTPGRYVVQSLSPPTLPYAPICFSHEILVGEVVGLATNLAVFPSGQFPGAWDATVSPISGTPPYSYVWSTGATTQTVLGLSSVGTFYVTTTDAGSGCVVVDTLNMPVLTGIAESNYSPDLAVVGPNPFTSSIVLDLKAVPKRQGAIIRLHDVHGKVLEEKKVSDGEGVVTLETADIPPGVYLLRITSSSGIFTRKVMKFE